MEIILASASPRRRELLSEITRDFSIMVEETDETLPSDIHPREGVGILALRKGEALFNRLRDEGGAHSDALILSADTLVEIDGEALGKPESKDDAHRMLRRLSGRWHNVHTGIAVRRGERFVCEVATTAVLFRHLTDEQIYEYIESGEPMDKAGSYGIQGLGGKFVSEIDGDFDTVVGLSLKVSEKLLQKMGADGIDYTESKI